MVHLMIRLSLRSFSALRITLLYSSITSTLSYSDGSSTTTLCRTTLLDHVEVVHETHLAQFIDIVHVHLAEQSHRVDITLQHHRSLTTFWNGLTLPLGTELSFLFFCLAAFRDNNTGELRFDGCIFTCTKDLRLEDRV